MINKENFFTSGWDFKESESEFKSKFQMVNVAFLLSSFGLAFGVIHNYMMHTNEIIPMEVAMLIVNVVLVFVLRNYRGAFYIVALIETVQFTFLFLFLIYTTESSSLKYVWIFTYPIVLLYFQNDKHATYWVGFIIIMMLLAPFQPFVDVHYSLFQITYIIIVLFIISVMICFYQKKINEAKQLILKQQKLLESRVKELKSKDTLLTVQSKQAVMGEMISMIAHQWRQPLSTVTLSISNMQVQQLLGKKIEDELFTKTLQDISDTVVYLSDTIDDFQTYYHPKKKLSEIAIRNLIQKTINLTQARFDKMNIELEVIGSSNEVLTTYVNELMQVMLNILNNAIDELESLKKIDSKVTLEIKSKNDSFEVSIRDNGKGISKEDRERIFDPYFSTKGKNGTGLGLYMSQMIMEKQFNSKIEVQSSSKGSEFSMSIPKELT